MEAQIACDVAYIKEAISNWARSDARRASLDMKIDRMEEELRQSRSRISELEAFQRVAQSVLQGIGISLLIAVGSATLIALVSHHSKEDDKKAAEHAQVTPQER